ncbi:uncharacterized [Tachysurus ichikawai]
MGSKSGSPKAQAVKPSCAQHDGEVQADSLVTDGANVSETVSISATAEKALTSESNSTKNTETVPVRSDGGSNIGSAFPTSQTEQASPEQSVETNVKLMVTQDSVTDNVVLTETTDEAMMKTVLKTPIKRKSKEHDNGGSCKKMQKRSRLKVQVDNEEPPPDLTVWVTTELRQ